MPYPKVKLTDIRSGQDYLFLVTKVNLKGLLVQSASTFPPGTSVRMRITFDEPGESLDLAGQVYKVTQRPGGGKGMIIRFRNPDAAAVDRIARYIERSSPARPAHTSAAPVGPSVDRTMVVEAPPPLESRQGIRVTATRDEEASYDARDLGGETRMLGIDDLDEDLVRKRRPRSMSRLAMAFAALAAVLLGAAVGRWILSSYTPEAEAPPPKAGETAVTPVETPEIKKPVTAPTATTAPAAFAGSGRLTGLKVEESQDLLKLTLKGSERLPEPEVSRTLDPRKSLHLVFPTLASFSVPPVLNVAKSPLFRVRTSKGDRGVEIVLDLYPIEFPRYEVRETAGSVSVLLYR